ncbi:hypothetical protein [Synoicihabitans lomoniglobus]|uniref:Uncharacterized protein n=1 Tax=Synoicihabitans lomoniglobus TaxID=2909285 RepID=A0AAF0CQR1_9BACT|nr:hypothetical protein [Opitutaceae bacterium LMO-M01]WED66261.1 hypothetical protein PXH66_05295 [Opitutaceae bacterium LMO-M01]
MDFDWVAAGAGTALAFDFLVEGLGAVWEVETDFVPDFFAAGVFLAAAFGAGVFFAAVVFLAGAFFTEVFLSGAFFAVLGAAGLGALVDDLAAFLTVFLRTEGETALGEDDFFTAAFLAGGVFFLADLVGVFLAILGGDVGG